MCIDWLKMHQAKTVQIKWNLPATKKGDFSIDLNFDIQKRSPGHIQQTPIVATSAATNCKWARAEI